MSSLARFAGVLLLSGCAAWVGCDSNAPARAPQRELAPYTGSVTKLFNDGIEARALGFDLEQHDQATTDAILRQRIERSDAILRVKVTTFTSKEEDSGRTFQIGFKTVVKVSGNFPPPEEFVVVAGANSPSLGLLKSFEARLIGMPFVVFVASFARADGESELHFHIAPDTDEELSSIRSASVLSEFKPAGSK